jgi:hypothetical protein
VQVFLLVLMLDNPRVSQRVMQAWIDLGIRGIHVMESAGCLEPEDVRPVRGPTGMLSFAHLLTGGLYCYALLLAPVDSLAAAEEAAAAVEGIAGPWAERRTAMMLALPVTASWGTPIATGPAGGEEGSASDH